MSNKQKKGQRAPDKLTVKRGAPRSAAKKAAHLGQVQVEERVTRPTRPGLLQFTLSLIYKNLYILGITILRKRLRFRRRVRLVFSKIKGSAYAFAHHFGQWQHRVWTNLSRGIKAPFLRIGATYRQQEPVIQARKAEGSGVFLAYLPVVEAVGRLVWTIIATIFNHLAPIVAAVVLLTVIQTKTQQPIGLLLEYEGQQMGYIRNETSFDTAVQLVRDRIIDENAKAFTAGIPSFTLEEVDRDELLTTSELADKIIRASGNEIEEAYGLYVGNRFLGAVTDKDVILETFDKIAAQGMTGKPNERTEFVKKIKLTKPTLFPTSSLVDPEELIQLLQRNEQEIETYEVQPGDTPGEIASHFGMPYAQLLRMNPTIEEQMRPGDQLLTQVARPYLSVKSIFTDVYEETVAFTTEEVENAMYAKSYRDVTQEGVDGLQRVTAEITTIDGQEVGREIMGEPVILREPVVEKVVIGVNNPQNIVSSAGSGGSGGGTTTDMTPAAPSSSGFRWPTSGGRATTYRNHSGNGVDIAIRHGEPIYASAAGTVVKVVNGYTGYGMHIIIDHGNGYETLYAHNSAMYVSVGDQVAQGQVIAAMGRTGWATGNHVHFEVRYKGRYMNPTDYIGYSA